MTKKILLITFIAGLAFLPFLGSVPLFDWDEANFAELAREMIVSGDYLQPQINFLPFYEKPPLFIWLQVLSMKVFGINEFAARFPNAIVGIVVLVSLFLIGKKHFSEKIGWLWALSFGGSLAPHFYFKSGLIDPIFNFFIFLSIYYFLFLFIEYKGKKWIYTLLSAFFTALAVMTKGPVAIILIVGSLGFTWILIKFKSWKSIGWAIPWILVMLGLSSIWFLYITKVYGDTYVKEFITYQIRLFETEDAKHGGTILFHPIALLLGCFPASIFMWTAFKKDLKLETTFQNIFFKAMVACGIVVLVVFSIVKTKIIHYSSMDYYPITFLSAIGLGYLIDNQKKISFFQIFILIFIAIVWTIALTALPYLGANKELIIPYINDANFQSQLKYPIDWNPWLGIIGLIFGTLFIYGFVRFKRLPSLKNVSIVFFACIFCIQCISLFHLPKIEQLVQGPFIKFYKSKIGQEVDIQPLYIKSYACYFYAKKQLFDNNNYTHLDYLYGNIKRPVYFVLREMDRKKLDTCIGSTITIIDSSYGKVIYRRDF